MKRSGQALVELLVAMSLTAIMLPALFAGFASARDGRAQQESRFIATMRAREAREALRVVRERGWEHIEVNGTYHPVISGSTWALAPNSEVIDGQTRSIVIADGFRDGNGAITSSGGTMDPSTKKITVTVSWEGLFSSSVTATFYLARYTNLVFEQTTEDDFLSGLQSGTTVTNNYGGEVTLGAGGSSSWCDPNLTITALDLPKNGVANGVTAIPGRIFAGTGDNASGVSFAHVAVSDTDPPVASIAGTFSNYKTNAVFGETDYAYVATDTNDQEVIIFNLTSLPYTVIGSFDSDGPTDGNSVFVLGNVGYMTAGNMLYTFNLDSRSGIRAKRDSVALAGEGKKVYVVGDYAYVATGSTSTQLQIVNVSDPDNITIVGSASVAGLAGVDVFVNQNGTRAFLATSGSTTQPEVFILDVSTKTGDRPTLGSYDTNGMSPKGIIVVPGNRSIVVGSGGEEYQVINIVSEVSPFRCGGLNIDTGVNGIATALEADGDAFSYIITGDATTELKIIEGGPGGDFSVTGVYESITFDASTSAAFNRFSVNGNLPLGTTLEYQFAVADAVNDSCDGVSFEFVGPNASTSEKFATSSALPFNDDGVGFENPGRCMRYRTYLNSTDESNAPEFEDITISYSP